MSSGATGRPTGADQRLFFGAEAEGAAALWYEDHGYEVLERKWRRREGEIDLIVRKGPTVAFCDFATQTERRSGVGPEPVLEATQRRIRRLASRWLSELTPAAGRARVEIRFDVASVAAGQVEVIEDAF